MFLQSLAAAGAALPLLPKALPSFNEAYAAEDKNKPINLTYPALSRAERDRRWAAVRRGMAKPQWNLDAILAPASGDTAYPRYLTQIGGRGGSADVIFPRDGSKPVHAIVSTARNRGFLGGAARFMERGRKAHHQSRRRFQIDRGPVAKISI